jgi:hypothetical protein
LKIIIRDYQIESEDTIRKGAKWRQYELMRSWGNHSISTEKDQQGDRGKMLSGYIANVVTELP